jgi:hypothetical protein
LVSDVLKPNQADKSLDVCLSYLKVVAFLCVEGGERPVFWKPDWLVDPSRARHCLGIAQLPTGPEQEKKNSPHPTNPPAFRTRGVEDTNM